MTGRHSGDGVKDGSHQLSDVNRQNTTTTTYEPPVNYQQLPSPPSPPSPSPQTMTYEPLDENTQTPVNYQQLPASSPSSPPPPSSSPQTMTYEPLDENTQTPVNYQQLPAQPASSTSSPSPSSSASSSQTAERQHDYYNVDNSSNINKETPYQELNTDTQPPIVYQQLE